VGQHLNNRGEVAIVGVLADRTTSGVFRYSDEDGLDSVVLAGQQIGESATRVSYVSDPLIDARGQVTFNAGLEDGRRGIWTASPVGGIRPILVADHELPGVPDSRFFSGTFVTNRHGQLAIHGVFFTEGDEVETGFFAQDVHGTLHKLIASGDSIEVAPGEFREIEAVNFSLSPSNNEDGGISHFNENGELAFIARFVDDSTGLFVASIPDLCDFDGDSLCGISDMNMITSIGDLTAGVSVGPGIDGRYDINGDKVVDVWDMDAWLLEAAARSGFLSAFLRGDANLDGKVDSIDLSVVNAQLFSLDGRWDHGDFNGDGIVDGSDFNFWNIHKQITISSLGQRVPEPNGMMNLAFFIAIAHYLMIRDRLIR
jgi:hypothetical protein